MRCSFRPLLLAALALAAAWTLGAGDRAWAHGAGWSQEKFFAVVLSFYYADQSPIAYAEVAIYSPADDKIPYQKGRSDRNGFFAFKPDAPGRWSFSAADGQGHLSRGEVEVTAEQLTAAPVAPAPGEGASAASPAPEASPPARGGASAGGIDPLKIVLGLSLIANLALIFRRRRPTGGRN